MTISTIIEESESVTPNAYFTKPADLAPETKARSVDINALSSAVKVAFDKVPDLVPLYTDTLAYAVDTGAVNAMMVTLSDNVESLVDGSAFTVKAAYGNTAATTIQVTGSTALGTFNVQRADGSAIIGGEWVAGQFLDLRYNATTGALQLAQLPSNSPTSGLPTTGGTMTGAIKEAKGADIASAANLNLTAATGNFLHVTGTTAITAITIPIGAEYTVIFDGVLTLTNGAGLLLPGAANITTAAGDRMDVRGDAAGAIVTNYVKASGAPIVAFPYLKVSDQKASGTFGGLATATNFASTRTFNTVDSNSIPGASLSVNQVTLPAGTYDARGRAPFCGTDSAKIALYNVTDAAYQIIGSSSLSLSTGASSSDSVLSGRFTISSPKLFSMRYYVGVSSGAQDLGQGTSSGQVEVYAELEFWKVA